MGSTLIIGASSSLGLSVMKNFSEDGYHIVATYSGAPDKVLGIESINAMHLDLTCNQSISDFSLNIRQKGYTFDLCVFLAASLPGKNIQNYKNEQLDQVMAINFSGFAKVYRDLESVFNKNSQIIIVSSISAQRGSYDPIYAASKGALISFMKSLSQVRPLKIRANAVAPGLLKDSSMYNDMEASRRSFHVDQATTGKLTNMEDLSKIIVDISKPHWSNLNGAVIQVNGGAYV